MKLKYEIVFYNSRGTLETMITCNASGSWINRFQEKRAGFAERIDPSRVSSRPTFHPARPTMQIKDETIGFA